MTVRPDIIEQLKLLSGLPSLAGTLAGEAAAEIERLRGEVARLSLPADAAQTIKEARDVIAACYAAGFLDDAGNVRKVLGTLPVTADGVIVCPGAVVWPHPDVQVDGEEGGVVEYGIRDDAMGYEISGSEWEPSKCYASRESARAAAEEGGGKL
jgi:hypothetical protein